MLIRRKSTTARKADGLNRKKRAHSPLLAAERASICLLIYAGQR